MSEYSSEETLFGHILRSSRVSDKNICPDKFNKVSRHRNPYLYQKKVGSLKTQNRISNVAWNVTFAAKLVSLIKINVNQV